MKSPLPFPFRLLFLIFGTLWLVCLHKPAGAQQPGAVYLPQYIGNDTLGQTDEQELLIFYFPLRSSALDIREFKKLLKDPYMLPYDSIVVDLPNLSGMSDSVYALAWLTNDLGKKGRLVPFIIGNYDTDQPQFFMDYNLDYNFRNDGPPFTFEPGEKRKKIKLQGEERGASKYFFTLLSPEKTKDYRRKTYAEKWAELIDPVPVKKPPVTQQSPEKLSIRFGTFYGWGNLRYRFHNLSSGYPIWYQTSSTDKGASLGLSYRFLSWRFSAFANYENLFYWSSTRTIRLGDPYIQQISGIGPVYFENIQVEINRDRLPATRISGGLNIEYAFSLGKIVELAPTVGAGRYHFTSKYMADFARPDELFTLRNDWFIQYGLLTHLKASSRASLLFGIQLQHNQFHIQDYFEQFNYSSLEKQFQNIRFRLAYQVKVF